MAISSRAALTDSSTHKILALALGSVLWIGCSNQAHRNPAALYAQAERDYRMGDLPSALKAAHKGSDAWSRESSSEWHWKFRLLEAEVLITQSDLKAAGPLLTADLPGVPDRNPLQALLLKVRGQAAHARSKEDDALRLLDGALTIARRSSAEDLMVDILVRRGSVLARNGKYGPSEASLSEAATLAARHNDTYWQATADGAMGFLFLRQARFDEAITWFQRSLAVSKNQYPGSAAVTIGNLGWCYYRLGDLENAEINFAQSAAMFEKSARAEYQQINLGNIGSVHLERGDYAGAISYYQRALAIAEKHQLNSWHATWLNHLAETYLEAGDEKTADAYNRRAKAVQVPENGDEVERWQQVRSAELATRRGEYTRALQEYQMAVEGSRDPDIRWEVHKGLADLYSVQGDLARSREEFGQATVELDDHWSELLNQQSKLTFLNRATRFYQRYVDFLMTHGLQDDALNFVEAHRARLLAEKLRAEPSQETLQQRARKTGATLLSYWLAPQKSYLWAVTARGIQSYEIGPEARIRELVERYTKSIQAGRDGLATGRELYETLVTPAQSLIGPGARLIVVPDGALHGLNFETLIGPSKRYLIEDATVEIAPSLRLLQQDSESANRNKSILLIGDPVRQDPTLPELPSAGKEIAAIAGLYDGAVVRVRADATPEAYEAAKPAEFGVIHFAAHALPNRGYPLDSAVVLSPGRNSYKLYARDVQNIQLNANLVTISACTSAGARAFPGEGLVGFAWAFLHAGAHNVIASLWEVSDQNTAAFMKELYQRVQKGDRPARALHDSKLEFLRSEGPRSRPDHWAPFQIYVP
jgi:CHAT domain-containing protein/Flp pilus assembly protein TadD